MRSCKNPVATLAASATTVAKVRNVGVNGLPTPQTKLVAIGEHQASMRFVTRRDRVYTYYLQGARGQPPVKISLP